MQFAVMRSVIIAPELVERVLGCLGSLSSQTMQAINNSPREAPAKSRSTSRTEGVPRLNKSLVNRRSRQTGHTPGKGYTPITERLAMDRAYATTQAHATLESQKAYRHRARSGA